mgnify:CR=1 FL=1
MRSLVLRELRATRSLTMVAVLTCVATILLMQADLIFWTKSSIANDIHANIVASLFALWVVVVVEHIAGRESTKGSRRHVATLPISMTRVFWIKFASCLLRILGVGIVLFGLELTIGGPPMNGRQVVNPSTCTQISSRLSGCSQPVSSSSLLWFAMLAAVSLPRSYFSACQISWSWLDGTPSVNLGV